MKSPKVSVVIPAYNHELYVGEAIQSVLDQSFGDLELIIINDGSTDHTEDEILKFKDDRIQYYSQENRGLSATLNRGIELAQGEYFNFLPSDDAFYPEKLEIQLELFKENPEMGVVFSYPQLVDAQGREIQNDPVALWPIVPYETKEEIFPALFERNFLSAPTALVRMDCFKKVGYFDESLKYAQDYDLWMRILKYYDTRLMKQPLVKYRWHGKNLTFRSTAETESERGKVVLKAYKNLSIEDIFPNLCQSQEKKDYCLAYQKIADFLEKSEVPALAPLIQIYRDMASSLESPTPNLLQWDEKKEERDVRFQSPKGYKEKIHVLMETQTLDKGGLEQVVFNLARGLGQSFFGVVVCEKGGAVAHRCKEIGIPVEVLQHDKAREYQEILDRYQIDIVVSHYSTFGARLAFEKGIPTLSVIHNIYSWFPDNVLSDFKSADPFVSKYIAVSEEVKSYTHYRFNIPLDKIVVIPNGIDPDEYLSRSPSKTIHRSEFDLREDDYVFINVASIGPPKAQNVILAALDKIIEACPQIKVLSVGGVLDEAYAHFLKERIEELQLSHHFKLVGQVEDVRPYLQMADAFLLTSLIEGWPLSVMEAMLHQLPVIATKVGGVSSILGNSESGVLLNNSYEDFRLLDVPSLDQLSRETSPRNAEEVAQAMKRFCEEKESWRQSGRKGYERVVKHFSLQGMVRSYEQELFSLYFALEKSRAHQHRRKIQEQERLLRENEEAINDLRSQIAYAQEQLNSKMGLFDSKIDLLDSKMSLSDSKMGLLDSKLSLSDSKMDLLDSKMGLLDSKIDGKYWKIEGQLHYILIRLSLWERVKGVVYRLMKTIHKLVPMAIREKYRNRYRRIFLDKVTPSDQKIFFDNRASAQGDRSSGVGEWISGLQLVERNPIQDFLAFKKEMKRGLPLELTNFRTNYVPGLVSVVLPVYNQAYLLGESIESVLQQTYSNLELIVVNDGSTDEIEKVLDPYRSHPRIKILDQENQKLPGALSNGFRQARGEFFTWTSADNLMDKRQLEAQVEFLIKHPDAQMVYSNYDIINDDGEPFLNSEYCPGYQKPFGSNHIHLPRDISELNVVRNNYIGPCFMYRHWVGRLIGDYDASMFTMEDYDYWMTINAFFQIEHLGKDDSLYFNRVHQDSLTGRKGELKIVEKTDRLMEFERVRREFYRKKFNVYLIGNDDRLNEIKGFLEANENIVRQFHIPCSETQMQNEKALGIWIHSAIEKGFIARVIRENPHAFFAVIRLDPKNSLDEKVLGKFGMNVAISKKTPEESRFRLWFYGDVLHSTLYPILCKANIELFRRQVSFDRWNS